MERRYRTGAFLALSAWALAACGAAPAQQPRATPPPTMETPSAASRLEQGLEALASARYPEAERLLRAALTDLSPGTERGAALVALAETLLQTGRRAEATALAVDGAANSPHQPALLAVGAEALRQQGQLDEALALLDRAEDAADGPPSEGQLEVILLRGEILLERGERSRATQALSPLFEAYNAEHISETAGRSLALVGRAAHLLRSPHDANDAFDEAERAAPSDVRTLVWRAELYLDKYDLAHAEEVLTEALERAPRHPQALVAMALVRLGQTLDFDQAERLARAALATNRHLSSAHFVLAGISLRDEELAAAEAHVGRGLQSNPRDLDLLSMGATARFLAEDRPGFDAAVDHVLGLNPEFTRLFQIVGEFADWEHRYDDIVRLMRRATRIDPEDGRSRAQLGLNLIRAGQDAAGVVELRRAFESDPFNVRVFNTLELYEKIIPRDYEQVRSGKFTIRYPKRERALLERYVPDLLERAYRTMVKHYGFEPEAPIGIELYEAREHFAVRTSGLPQTAIQGVCFGRTLATLSLAAGPANLGMTLWHELAHVFHIQLSKSRVPRWFTEGVAELETTLERPEWSRELEPQLYQTLRADRLPHVAQLTQAFTRAEHMEDVATAYFASNRIAAFLRERHGMEGLGSMLRGWGAGQSAVEVLDSVLGQTPKEVDQAFRAHLEQSLQRFQGQFVPRKWRGSLRARREAADEKPDDLDAQLGYALALFDRGRAKDAEARAESILKKSPKHADARFALARMQLARDATDQATRGLEMLLAHGHDGYEPRLLLGKLALQRKDAPAAEAHFSAAHRHDPRAAEPLLRLAEIHQRSGNQDAELAALRLLAPLEEHAGALHRRLLELLTERALWAEAVAAGEAALWTDLSDARIHSLFALALEKTGATARALFELESAALCPGSESQRASALQELSAAYARAGKSFQADAAAREARALGSTRATD